MQKKVIEPNIAPKIKTKRYSNGGVKSKTTYVNGKEHGVAMWWREDGSKRREITWRDGKKHGRDTGWYEDGRKWWEDIWRDGKKQGIYTYWAPIGAKQSARAEGYCLHNKKYAFIEWDVERNVTEADFPFLKHPSPSIPTSRTSCPPQVLQMTQEIINPNKHPYGY